MNKQLLTLNSPNLNGRTYKSDAVKAAIDRFVAKGTPPIVYGSHSPNYVSTPLENAVGVVKDIKVLGDELIGDVQLFPGKEMFEQLTCRPTFIGQIDENGVAYDLELVSFSFTNDPA